MNAGTGVFSIILSMLPGERQNDRSSQFVWLTTFYLLSNCSYMDVFVYPPLRKADMTKFQLVV